jgi:hypothetical protein
MQRLPARTAGGLPDLALLAMASVVAGTSCRKSGGIPSHLSPQAKATLRQFCDAAEACGRIDSYCTSSTISMCLARLADQAALIDYFDCRIAKPCAEFGMDDECVQGAGTSDAERDEFIARCKEWMRAYRDCLDLSCAELESCFDSVGLDVAWIECLRPGSDAGTMGERG